MAGASIMNLATVFPFRRPPGAASAAPRVRLLCFPYAGGAAALYRHWPAALPQTVDVCPVELPGRGLRHAEPPSSDIMRICDELVAALDDLPGSPPIAVFGHSMGARIAFEMAHRLDRRVAHCFASAAPAPGLRRHRPGHAHLRPISALTDDEFKQRLRALGGTPPQVLDNDELMARALPTVRADFILIEQYRPDPELRIPSPITVFTGADDHGVTASDAVVLAWRDRTTARARILELDAGHFFLDSHRDHLHREIVADLAPWLA
jgi:medium-chain acyl-[acyl-carrier-protein] hydrolase